jgi:hypothetical protein
VFGIAVAGADDASNAESPCSEYACKGRSWEDWLPAGSEVGYIWRIGRQPRTPDQYAALLSQEEIANEAIALIFKGLPLRIAAGIPQR